MSDVLGRVRAEREIRQSIKLARRDLADGDLGLLLLDEARKLLRSRPHAPAPASLSLPKPVVDVVMGLPLRELDLSIRALNCLEPHNIQTVGDLCKRTVAELMTWKWMGRTTLREIDSKLASVGVCLAGVSS